MIGPRLAASALVAVALAISRPGPPLAAEGPLAVSIVEPAEGARVLGGESLVYVRGHAHPPGGAPGGYDVMLVIDTSGSTGSPSGVTLHRDGVVQRRRGEISPGRPAVTSDGPGDSVLAVGLAAAEALLARVDHRLTRVGVVTFAGPAPVSQGGLSLAEVPAAVLAQPLTGDFDQVRGALRRIREAGPAGGTDMAAGIRLAVRELLALRGSVSPPDPRRRKVAFLLTDGMPTLPFGRGRGDRVDPRDVELAASAARVAATGGAIIHTFGLGPEAVAAPLACTAVAEATGGRFTPLWDPAQILEVLPRTSLAGVDVVSVRNLTAGRFASDIAVTAEGAFRAAVPLVRGPNQIAVTVSAGAGREGRAQIWIHYVGPRRLDVEVFRERDLPGGLPLQPQAPRRDTP